MGDDTWKILSGAAITGFSAMATALAWVVKAWRADNADLTAKLVAALDAGRDRLEASAEKDRTVQTKNADAIHALADGLKGVVQGQDRLIEHQDRLTAKVAQWRDETRMRPRSNESDNAFEPVVREPSPGRYRGGK